jgi:hypothetical protein
MFNVLQMNFKSFMNTGLAFILLSASIIEAIYLSKYAKFTSSDDTRTCINVWICILFACMFDFGMSICIFLLSFSENKYIKTLFTSDCTTCRYLFSRIFIHGNIILQLIFDILYFTGGIENHKCHKFWMSLIIELWILFNIHCVAGAIIFIVLVIFVCYKKTHKKVKNNPGIENVFESRVTTI